MILRGERNKLRVTVLECSCGNYEESIRLSFHTDADVPEIYLTVTRPKVSLWRWIKDYFDNKFWVEILVSREDALEIAKILEFLARKLEEKEVSCEEEDVVR